MSIRAVGLTQRFHPVILARRILREEIWARVTLNMGDIDSAR